MENKNIQIVKDYFKGWETGNKELLKLSPELKFTSPDDCFVSSEDFLKQCWQYHGLKYDCLSIISEGNDVCVKYSIDSGEKKFENSEWIKLENGLIKEITVFYGTK